MTINSKSRLKDFQCAIFLDDDTILEGIQKAKTPEWAVSQLLSDEAIKRKTFYFRLMEKVLDGGALVKQITPIKQN